MKQTILFLSIFNVFNLIAQPKTLRTAPLPPSPQNSIADNYFGQTVPDPYRWLEDDRSPETAEWVKKQNEYTQFYLNQIPYREFIRTQLSTLWNYEKVSAPIKRGPYYLFYKNDGLQNQSVLYIRQGLEATPKVLINPNTLNEKGTSALGSVELSKKQTYTAFAVSQAGSDWQDILVMETATGKMLSDTIRYSKFSGISWRNDDGFYYSGYDKPAENTSAYSAKTEYQKIFFHKIGTPQNQDQLIYEDRKNPLRYKSVRLSEDQQWLVLNLSEGTDGAEIQIKSVQEQNFKMLCAGYQHNYDVVDVINNMAYVMTNYQAPNYKLVAINPNNPDPKNWKTILPEKEYKLESVNRVGNQFIVHYLKNAASEVNAYQLTGQFIRNIKLPGIGTVGGFDGSANDTHTFFAFTSFNSPTAIYRYDLADGKVSPYTKPQFSNPLDDLVVEQKWFTSKDGTKVPMFLYHRKGLDMKSGQNPVFLYGYGGFNIPLTPSFSVPSTLFAMHNGIYAVVNLRGGSEFGEAWHQAGMLNKKQNVFDDFISAAEFLIKEKITCKEKLAIHGRSNGGLLVGACMTQRPDLFQVALPGVGVLDMLRYHKFTVGWGWAVEYGSSDNEEAFNYLIKYSPLHNIKQGTRYPATLITTADHDDRVVPAHSFKFAATLQEKNDGVNPMLIRIDTQAGHGAGKPTAKQIDEWADVLSFVLHHLNVPIKF
ncbi:MAG: prolyl oligopeptidase family serine peptidase [Chitinophagaceae bacterium]